jgi:hypothetical protein
MEEVLSFTDVVKRILSLSPEPITPQEIRDQIKQHYSRFYGTASHLNNVERGHYQNIDYALLAQIYSLVRTNDSFFCDKNCKPMRISLVDEEVESNPSIEDYESEQGIVYVLKTDTYTKDGKEIIKIGFTGQNINQRINQLYTTGVPFKFKIHKTYSAKNFIELESAIHNLLGPFKLNKSREFFTEDALEYIEKIVEINCLVQKEK